MVIYVSNKKFLLKKILRGSEKFYNISSLNPQSDFYMRPSWMNFKAHGIKLFTEPQEFHKSWFVVDFNV